MLKPAADPASQVPDAQLPNGTIITQVMEPAGQLTPHLTPDQCALMFVLGIWALTLVAALAFVAMYSSDAPFWSDEWIYVPVLTGNEPVTGFWLWHWHNEHRIPLPKLVWLAAFRLTNDFRAVPFLSVLALGALGLAMIRAARQLRGYPSYADAFFPLVLLNGAQAFNLLLSLQVQMVSSTVLAGLVLLVVVKHGNRLTLRMASVVGLCLLLLPLCGSNGLILVPLLALWLGYWGVCHWRSGEPNGRRNGLIIGALVIAALGLMTFCVLDLPKNPDDPVPQFDETLRTGLEFLSGSLGPGVAKKYWPVSWRGMSILLLLSAAVVVVGWYRRPGERGRTLGLLLFLAAIAALGLGIGWGRGGSGPGAGFDSRYVTAALPALCCVYFMWGNPGSAGRGRFVQMTLFTLTCALFVSNWQDGITVGNDLRRVNEALEKDLAAGMPCSLLAQRHSEKLCNGLATEDVARSMQMLHDAGVGQFRRLKADPDCDEVSIAVAPVEVQQMTWLNGSGKGQNDNSYVAFSLKRPQLLGLDPHLVYEITDPLPVYAIRLTYAYHDAGGSASFRLSWGNDRSFRCALEAGSEERTKTIWVNDTLDQFRIYPDDKPFLFKLLELTLLVPKSATSTVKPSLLRPPFARAQANEPITVETCDGKQVLRVHAPSTVEFDVAARSRRSLIAGKFGILPGAYGNPHDHTDGVQFTIEYTTEGKSPKLLFNRLLDPEQKPEDRRMQEFAVWLPPGEKGTVVLKAFHPPGKREHLGWSYWTDVDIQGAQGTPFVTPFARAWANEPITIEECESKEVLRVHAPSGVEFDVAARSQPSRVAGKFGILPGAPYGNPEDHTDGVQFAVEYVAAGRQPLVLFEKFLDPQAKPADRAMQQFDVWLPPGGKGKVILKAFNPPGKSAHLDWSYWTDVEIESVSPEPPDRPQARVKKTGAGV